MFDEMKIQALANSLRATTQRHIHRLTGEHIMSANAIDGMLYGIIERLLVEMLEDGNDCLALLETLVKEFDV